MFTSKLLQSQKQLEEIDPSLSRFDSKRNREGDWCLFFKKQELVDLFGHYVKFYPNGVLLVLSDDAKDFLKKNYPELKYESKSFVFYNNEDVENVSEKEPIFKIHNRNKNKDTKSYDEPIRDVDVVVCEHYLYVREVGNSIKEYLVDVLTGEKIQSLTKEDQYTMDSLFNQ